MQDARVRLGSAALLSVAAFISIQGACVVFLWWLIFVPHKRSVHTRLVIPGMIALIGFVAILIVISGGDGFSYFVRMTLVLFIGTWLYAEQKLGDFLSVAVWILGKRTGFDIGMVGECAMQMAGSLTYDLMRIKTALKLKEQVFDIKTLVPIGLVLIHDAMIRASDISELLAARGYRNGGTVCPVFRTSTRDLLAGICAICTIIFAITPVSEFFILYR